MWYGVYMHNIPLSLRKELATDPYYSTCARKGLHGHECGGRVTWEHALIYAGVQVQKRFAIIPLCAKAHAVDGFQDGGDFSKDINVWIALNRATEEELLEISRAVDHFRLRNALNIKYGPYVYATSEKVSINGIEYPWLQKNYQDN